MPSEAEGGAAARSVNTPLVVIVDDEDQILISFSVYLRLSGIDNVLTLNDNRDLIRVLSERDPAVVVLDITMPHQSGTKLLPLIRKDFPNVRVIAMSGDNHAEMAGECLRAGADDYLAKPVPMERFLTAIRTALAAFQKTPKGRPRGNG